MKIDRKLLEEYIHCRIHLRESEELGNRYYELRSSIFSSVFEEGRIKVIVGESISFLENLPFIKERMIINRVIRIVKALGVEIVG